MSIMQGRAARSNCTSREMRKSRGSGRRQKRRLALDSLQNSALPDNLRRRAEKAIRNGGLNLSLWSKITGFLGKKEREPLLPFRQFGEGD